MTKYCKKKPIMIFGLSIETMEAASCSRWKLSVEETLSTKDEAETTKKEEKDVRGNNVECV